MSKTARHIINAVSAVILTACLTAAYMSGTSCHSPLECKGLRVEIADSSVNGFVSQADIRKYIDKEYGQYMCMPLDSIDLVKIEKIIDGRSAVNKSEAYVTRDGMLNIKVTQRTPIVRFQKKEGGFYADAEGFLFPLQSSYSSRVHVIDGEIPLKANSGYKGNVENPDEKLWLDKVLEMINFMESSNVWKDKIVQITVCEGGELMLIPREGHEKFRFGQPIDIEDKFRRMELYYSNIIPEKGKDFYKSVSVEYDGQIVCK